MVAIVILYVLIGTMSALSLIFILWQIGISVAAVTTKPITYPDIPPQKFAVLICARNEEQVIGTLLKSLQMQNYPKDCYQVFIVAHNCSDHTAEISEQYGFNVLIKNDPSDKLKSDAIRYALNYLGENRPGEFDCFCIFDADSIAEPDFLYELNKGFAFGADAVSGYYDSRNFNASLMSRVTGTLYHVVMHTTCDSQNRLGLPVNVYGSGFSAKMKWSGEIAELNTLVDDFELSIRLVLKGAKLTFAPDAVFYAEMPEDLKNAIQQRRRWTCGDFQCFLKYGRTLLRAVPSLGFAAVKQLADAAMVPVCLLTALGILLGLILSALSHHFGMYLLFISVVLILFQIAGSIIAANSLKSRHLTVRENLGAILLTPAWIGITLPLSLAAVFLPIPEWAPTPRTSQNQSDETGL